MDNSQILTIALAAVRNMPAVLAGILINNARLSDTNTRISELRSHMDTRFNDVDRRFDEMRDLWRSELYRVEQVTDARLKRLEERELDGSSLLDRFELELHHLPAHHVAQDNIPKTSDSAGNG